MGKISSNLDLILLKHNYETLSIMRAGNDCYLVIKVGDESHVYSGAKGKKKVYRHAWQIKDWLKEAFGIEPDAVQVNVIKYDKYFYQCKFTGEDPPNGVN